MIQQVFSPQRPLLMLQHTRNIIRTEAVSCTFSSISVTYQFRTVAVHVRIISWREVREERSPTDLNLWSNPLRDIDIMDGMEPVVEGVGFLRPRHIRPGRRSHFSRSCSFTPGNGWSFGFFPTRDMIIMLCVVLKAICGANHTARWAGRFLSCSRASLRRRQSIFRCHGWVLSPFTPRCRPQAVGRVGLIGHASAATVEPGIQAGRPMRRNGRVPKLAVGLGHRSNVDLFVSRHV